MPWSVQMNVSLLCSDLKSYSILCWPFIIGNVVMLSGVPIPSKNGEVISDIVATMLLTHDLVMEVSDVPPPPHAVAKNDKSNIVFFMDAIIHQYETHHNRILLLLLLLQYYWCPRRDSNSQNLVSKTSTYTNSVTWAYLVQPVGIEPTSTALQTAAMTTSAKVAWYLVTESNCRNRLVRVVFYH